LRATIGGGSLVIVADCSAKLTALGLALPMLARRVGSMRIGLTLRVSRPDAKCQKAHAAGACVDITCPPDPMRGDIVFGLIGGKTTGLEGATLQPGCGRMNSPTSLR
jgi:hypothetical protein